MPTHGSQYLRSSLLLLGAFAFGFNGLNLLHELGHVLAFRLTGASVDRVVIHPFGLSYVQSPSSLTHPVFVFAAGMLFSVAVGLLLVALARYVGSAWIAPVLVTGVCCVLGNGVYYLVTIFLRARGDATKLVSLGVSWSLVVEIALCLALGGLVLSLYLLPAVGLRRSHGLLMRLAVVWSGMGPYFLAMTLHNIFWNRKWFRFWSAYAILFMAVMTVMPVLSMRLKLGAASDRPESRHPTWPVTIGVLALGLGTVALALLIYDG